MGRFTRRTLLALVLACSATHAAPSRSPAVLAAQHKLTVARAHLKAAHEAERVQRAADRARRKAEHAHARAHKHAAKHGALVKNHVDPSPYAACETPRGDSLPVCDDYQRDVRALVGGAL